MCRQAARRGFIQIRNMITEDFCPGLAPGEVKDSTHNLSAVCLLADSGPDAHPFSCHVVSFRTIVCLPGVSSYDAR